MVAVVVLLLVVAGAIGYVVYLHSQCLAPFSCGDLASVHTAVSTDQLAIAGSAEGGLWAAADGGATIVHIGANGEVDRRIPAPGGHQPVIRLSEGGGRLLVQQAGTQYILDPSTGRTWPAPTGGDVAIWADGRWWIEGLANLVTYDATGGGQRTIELPGSATFSLAGVSNGAAWVTASRGSGHDTDIELLRVDENSGQVTTVDRVSHAGVANGNQPVLGGNSVWLGYERFDASSRLLERGQRLGQFQLAPMRFIDHSDPTGSTCVSAVAWSPNGSLWQLCASRHSGRVARIRPGTPSSPGIKLSASSGVSVRPYARLTVDGQGRAWFVASNKRVVGYGPSSGPAVYAPGAPRSHRGPLVAVGLVLLVAAVVTWWLWFAAERAALRRRRHLPRPAAATMDLGSESPAIVNLLVHAGEVTTEAVPATLLDLAARRHIEVFEASPDEYACRLRSKPTEELRPYERQVYDVVADAAKDGSVPVATLSASMHPESAAFWGLFRQRVRKEARDGGLVGGHFSAHLLIGLVPQVLLAAGLTALVPAGVVLWVPLALGLWIVSFVIVLRHSADLLSAKGQDAAARWLGVRDFLAGDDAFKSLPPAAVAIWDRYLAYAAAMGVAKDAAKGLLLAFRTTPTHADHEHAMAMLHDPLGAIASMPADLRPDSLQGFGQAEPFGPPSDDFAALVRGLMLGGPGVAMEAAAGAPPERQAAIAAAVRTRLDQLAAAAPEPIHADAQVVHDALVGAIGDALDHGLASPQQLQALGEQVAAAMQVPDVAPSWSRVQEYLVAHGLTPAAVRP